MKNEYLLDSLRAIDDSMLKEAGEYSPKKRRMAWMIPAAAAALAVLTLGIALLAKPKAVPLPKAASINLLHPLDDWDPNIVLSYKHDMAVAEGKEVDLEYNYVPPENAKVDWVTFFKYDGRLYWLKDSVPKDKYKGERVLRVKLSPNDPMNCPEGKGHVEGDVYTVNGYDPAFMLCIPSWQYEDEVDIYICDNGYSVTYGRDVLEDRLFVSRDLKKVIYEDMDSRFHSWGKRYAFNAGSAEADALIKALDEAPWCVPYETEEEREAMFNVYEEGSSVTEWVVRLELGDLSVTVRIYDNGYATVHEVGGSSYYLKYDEKKIKPFMDAMKAGAGELQENCDTMRGLTLEQAREDETYGAYVPDYIPAGLGLEYCLGEYEVDRKTKETLGTKELHISFQDDPQKDRYLWVNIGDLEPVERSRESVAEAIACGEGSTVGWDIALSDLSADEIRRVCEGVGDDDYFYFVVYEGEVSVSVTARNVSPDELVKAVESCFGISGT